MSIFMTVTTCLLDREGDMRGQECVKVGNNYTIATRCTKKR